MRSKGIEVSQGVANEMAASFSNSQFQDALKDWVVADNQSLRVIETPQFRAMIAAVNPLAEALLWRSHQTLRDYIIAEYNEYVPAVAAYLAKPGRLYTYPLTTRLRLVGSMLLLVSAYTALKARAS